MIRGLLDWSGLSKGGLGSLGHGHTHVHSHEDGHSHTHGVIDPSIAVTERGIWAIKWSFVILAATAILQLAVVLVSGSVALLADTIHNVADATTAIPLWIAFRLAHRKATETFTYGYGRVEDLAGLTIVAIILLSALVAAYEAINRFLHPIPIEQLAWVAVAGVIGFLGNEFVAVLRINTGRKMNSAALIADGYHARTDGLTSLAVVLGAALVWVGFPLADPIVGMIITAAIFVIVWQSAKSVLIRMLDGIDPAIADDIRHSAEHVHGIKQVSDVKARWLGHRLQADVTVLVEDTLTIRDVEKISSNFKSEMRTHIPALANANVLFQSPSDA